MRRDSYPPQIVRSADFEFVCDGSTITCEKDPFIARRLTREWEGLVEAGAFSAPWPPISVKQAVWLAREVQGDYEVPDDIRNRERPNTKVRY